MRDMLPSQKERHTSPSILWESSHLHLRAPALIPETSGHSLLTFLLWVLGNHALLLTVLPTWPHQGSHHLPCLLATTSSRTTPLSQGKLVFIVRLLCVSWALPSFDPQKLPRQEDCPQTSPFTQEETETQRLDISLGVPSPSLGGAPWKQGLCHILSLLGTTVF